MAQGHSVGAIASNDLIRQGEKLVASLHVRCVPHLSSNQRRLLLHAEGIDSSQRLDAFLRWRADAKMQPGYQLTADDQAALRRIISQPRPGEDNFHRKLAAAICSCSSIAWPVISARGR